MDCDKKLTTDPTSRFKNKRTSYEKKHDFKNWITPKLTGTTIALLGGEVARMIGKNHSSNWPPENPATSIALLGGEVARMIGKNHSSNWPPENTATSIALLGGEVTRMIRKNHSSNWPPENTATSIALLGGEVTRMIGKNHSFNRISPKETGDITLSITRNLSRPYRQLITNNKNKLIDLELNKEMTAKAIQLIDSAINSTKNNEDSPFLTEYLNQVYSEIQHEQSKTLDSNSKALQQYVIDFDTELKESSVGLWALLNERTRKIYDFLPTFKEKQPFLFLIAHIVFIIYIIVIFPAIEEVIKNEVLNNFNYENEEPKEKIKQLKKEIVMEIEDVNYLNNIRITNRDTSVYKSSSRKSGKIDAMSENRPVIILVKKRSWSFIVYKNSKDEEKTGWVFTKNLLK